jgi:hypothetical protein
MQINPSRIRNVRDKLEEALEEVERLLEELEASRPPPYQSDTSPPDNATRFVLTISPLPAAFRRLEKENPRRCGAGGFFYCRRSGSLDYVKSRAIEIGLRLPQLVPGYRLVKDRQEFEQVPIDLDVALDQRFQHEDCSFDFRFCATACA